MFLQLGEGWVRLIGDPHLGKEFKNGVALHRRGEREKNQFEEFRKQLNDHQAPDGSTVKAVICVGDLFDGFNVTNEVVDTTYNLVADAATAGLIRGVEFLILMGNHDVTRNLNLRSSFDLLSKMAFSENVHFVKDVTDFYLKNITRPILLCPYNAFVSTGELFKDMTGDYVAAIGHWDTKSFGNDHNVLPYKELASICDVIVTGHEHNPRTFTYEQTQIIVTGSMLPYSFAEDAEETIYVTRTLKQFLENPQDYSEKCLRLILEPGDTVPEDIDALQVSFKYVNKENEEELEVELEDFNLQDLFTKVFKENEVSDETIQIYWGKYQDAASA